MKALRGVLRGVFFLPFPDSLESAGLKGGPSEAASVNSHICLAFEVLSCHSISYGALQAA